MLLVFTLQLHAQSAPTDKSPHKTAFITVNNLKQSAFTITVKLKAQQPAEAEKKK